MAVLPSNDRAQLLKDFSEELSRTRTVFNLSKADLQAAVDAIDSWVDANAGSFNTSIPQPARTTLTASQKAALLLYVVRRRWEVG